MADMEASLQAFLNLIPPEAADLARALGAELPEADRILGTIGKATLLHSAWRIGHEPPHVDPSQGEISAWTTSLLKDIEAPSQALTARTRATVIELLEGRGGRVR